MYAEIIVDRPIIQRRQKAAQADENPLAMTFHYHIPPALAAELVVGHLVSVPFRAEQLSGVVTALTETSPVAKTRPVTAILDPIPVLTAAQLKLARWLSHEYLAPLATCVKFFLPPGSARKPEFVLELTPAGETFTGPLPGPAHTLLVWLRQQKSTPLADTDPSAAKSLLEQKLVQKRGRLTAPKVGPKIDRTVELLIPPHEVEMVLPTLGRASKQADILLYLLESDDPLPALHTVLTAVGCTRGPVLALAKNGWVNIIPAETRLIAPPRQSTKVQFDEPERLMLTIPPPDLNDIIIELRHSQKYVDVLRMLAAEEGPVWIGWVYTQTEANLNILRKLAEANFIGLNEARHWRDPLAGRIIKPDTPPRLTPEQESVWQEVSRHWQETPPPERPILLHGVTGSGKTEIYLRAITAARRAGQGAIMLVPEITLAVQTVERVGARFPHQVAIWHSALSPGERYDTWERVRRGELPIVVGPRSALFAPVQNLGVIIVDEEHEPVYKQRDRAPIYHAREAALTLGKLTGALVILGSATPDVASYRLAERGEYRLLSLPNRVLAHTKHAIVAQRLRQAGKQIPAPAQNSPFISLPLPPVKVIDMREELKAGNRTIFSRALQAGIHDTLKRNEQVILFLNRRGTASFVVCRDCGHVLACPRCETNLTHHAKNNVMVCHYCGYRSRPPETCPACNSRRIRYFGLGTQRVEDTVREMFPQAQTLRWDWDTTRQKGSHDIFLQHFVEGRANVMIGTQMVAKGLDLPLVTLVGVISADTALYLPDFRAGERTFQLLMQVAGRAGRSPLGGKVIVQSYNPDQVPIEAAANHDYEGFYQTELAFRREQRYPPFKRLALLLYSGPGMERSAVAARQLAEDIRLHVARQGLPAVEIMGPTPSYVRRVHNQYRWHILIRAYNPAEVLRPLTPLPYGWRVDIDPVTLL